LNILFFGTSDFAVLPLDSIYQSTHRILGVVTQPDKKSGRSLQVNDFPVKIYANRYKLPVFQPGKFDDKFLAEISRIQPDICVVIAYGKMLTKKLLSLPKFFTINLHPSLLPKYRGAAPINWAIINGEKKTGVSIIRLNEKMDQGDTISREDVVIAADDDAITLSKKLSIKGADLLMKMLDEPSLGSIAFTKQDEQKATYAKKLTKKDGLINWNLDAAKILNLIKGLLPWPTAYTYYGKTMVKMYSAEITSGKNVKAGEIIKSDNELIIGTGFKCLKINELQAASGKKMDAASYLRGHSMKQGSYFTNG